MFSIVNFFPPEPLSQCSSNSTWSLLNSIGVGLSGTVTLTELRSAIQTDGRKVNHRLVQLVGDKWYTFSHASPDDVVFNAATYMYETVRKYYGMFGNMVANELHGTKPIFMPYSPSFKWASFEPRFTNTQHTSADEEASTHVPLAEVARVCFPVVSISGAWLEMVMLQHCMATCMYLKAIFGPDATSKEYLTIAGDHMKSVKVMLAENYRTQVAYMFNCWNSASADFPRDLTEQWCNIRLATMSVVARYRKIYNHIKSSRSVTTNMREACRNCAEHNPQSSLLNILVNEITQTTNTPSKIPVAKLFYQLSVLYKGMKEKMMDIAMQLEHEIPRSGDIGPAVACASSLKLQAAQAAYKSLVYMGIGLYFAYRIAAIAKAAGYTLDVDSDQLMISPSRALAIMYIVLGIWPDKDGNNIPIKQETPPSEDAAHLAKSYMKIILDTNGGQYSTLKPSSIAELKASCIL